MLLSRPRKWHNAIGAHERAHAAAMNVHELAGGGLPMSEGSSLAQGSSSGRLAVAPGGQTKRNVRLPSGCRRPRCCVITAAATGQRPKMSKPAVVSPASRSSSEDPRAHKQDNSEGPPERDANQGAPLNRIQRGHLAFGLDSHGPSNAIRTRRN